MDGNLWWMLLKGAKFAPIWYDSKIWYDPIEDNQAFIMKVIVTIWSIGRKRVTQNNIPHFWKIQCVSNNTMRVERLRSHFCKLHGTSASK